MADIQIAVIDEKDTQIALAVPGIQGPAGAISSGGSANQVFYKVSGTNYDAGWTFIGNANVDAAAAIAGTKISPNFGSQATVTTGTNTAASFIPTSATIPSNGIYLPGANQVGVATNGTGRLFVDASGRVALGGTTVTDLNLLNIQGSTATDNVGVVLNKTNGTAQVWGIQNSGSLNFFNYTASSTALTINTSNQVGIGTSSPDNALHIETTLNRVIRASTSDTGVTNSLLISNGSNYHYGALGNVSGTTLIGGDVYGLGYTASAGADFTPVLSWTANTGRVGIGTTTVSDKLHVAAGNITLSYADGSTGVRNKIIWRTEDPFFGEVAYIAANRTASSFAPTDIVIATGTSAGVSEKCRVTSDGKLLVGTVTGNANGGILQLSGGITFPATAVAATDVNTLDDYEEGTFLPTVNGSTTAGTGTYTSRSGKYTKIGNVVTFCLDFILSAHTGTGDMLVAGLPFPSDAINYQANIVARHNLSLTASHYFGGSFISPSTSFIELSQMPVGGGTPAAIPMDSVCDVRLQGFYYV